MSKFQIVEIFRSPNTVKDFEFVLLLFKDKLELKKVQKSSNCKLLKGEVFKNDFISITAETPEGVDFEVYKGNQLEVYEGPLNITEYIYGSEKHLPFLNDTLPYFNLPLPVHEAEKLNATTYSFNNILFYNILGGLNSPIIGRIVYKTRINQTNSTAFKFYFFMILEVGRELLKVVVWRENIKYSSLEVGDVVGLQKYRVNKGYAGLLCLEYNRFNEAAYFDIKEVTGTEIVKLNVSLPVNKTEPVLDTVKGYISYKSVLNRRVHGGLDEYYLLVVDSKPIVLFYNSDPAFYTIEAGNVLEITNLRKVDRAGFTFFISSIFTQISFEKHTELDEFCSSFLYESKKPTKRNLDCEEDSVKRKNLANKVKDLFSNSSEGDSTEVSFLEKIPPEQESKEVSQKEPTSSDNQIADVVDIHDLFEESKSFIEVAVGFIPDAFSSLDEIVREENEIVNNKEYSVPMFYRPVKTSLKDLVSRTSLMLINEVTKWVVKAELIEMDFSNFNHWEEQKLNDGVCISYIKDKAIREQLPAFVRIRDETELTCYLLPNFFTGETELSHLYYMLNKSSSYEEALSTIGSTFYFVIQAFRASDENILYIVTGVISDLT